jgi:hypothetical protein
LNAAAINLQSAAPWRLVAGVLLAAASAAFFWHPLGLLMMVCLFAVINPTNDFKWLFLLSACVLFTILNVSKLEDDDLTVYINLQDYLAARPFDTLFNTEELRLLSGTYRVTEIGFYAPLWVIGQVIPDSRTALAVAATLAIYLPTFLGLALIARSEEWSRGMLLTVAFFAFFAGINFVQSTHLIRQYISGALLFYAFALYLTNRNGWGLFAALYACAVHNGTAPMIPAVVATFWLFRYRGNAKRGFGAILIRGVAMLVVLAATMAAIPLVQGEFITKEVPNIHAVHFLIVGAFFVIANVAIRVQHLRLKSLHYTRLAFLAIYILSLGFFSVGLPLYALRYFAYLEWLYALLLGAIIFHLFRDHPGLRVFFRFTVCLAAAAILVERITVSEYMFGPGDNYLLSWDFFQVAQLVSR